jgi:hypothetical protein
LRNLLVNPVTALLLMALLFFVYGKIYHKWRYNNPKDDEFYLEGLMEKTAPRTKEKKGFNPYLLQFLRGLVVFCLVIGGATIFSSILFSPVGVVLLLCIALGL